MKGPFYVMLAYRPNRTENHVYVFGDGCTLKQAHISAEQHFRTEYKHPSSVQVMTSVLAQYDTFAQTEAFVERLGQAILHEGHGS